MFEYFKRIFWRNRGLGCLRNIYDPRDRKFESELTSIPNNASVEKYVTEVLDQRATSSCVAHSVAHAISIMEKKSGFDYGTPSRLFLYWNSRRQHNNEDVDQGTYIRACMKGLRSYGVPDEAYWPFKIARVNDKPAGFSPWTMADSRKDGEYLAIDALGNERTKMIRQAVAEGYPVVFGTALVKSFLSSKGPLIVEKPRFSDPIVGRHAMCIVGYENRLYRVLNSWGKQWRDNGFCWMTEDYIKWLQSSDFTIVRGWARLNRED